MNAQTLRTTWPGILRVPERKLFHESLAPSSEEPGKTPLSLQPDGS
jgi:hypothetical protein